MFLAISPTQYYEFRLVSVQLLFQKGYGLYETVFKFSHYITSEPGQRLRSIVPTVVEQVPVPSFPQCKNTMSPNSCQ